MFFKFTNVFEKGTKKQGKNSSAGNNSSDDTLAALCWHRPGGGSDTRHGSCTSHVNDHINTGQDFSTGPESASASSCESRTKILHSLFRRLGASSTPEGWCPLLESQGISASLTSPMFQDELGKVLLSNGAHPESLLSSTSVQDESSAGVRNHGNGAIGLSGSYLAQLSTLPPIFAVPQQVGATSQPLTVHPECVLPDELPPLDILFVTSATGKIAGFVLNEHVASICSLAAGAGPDAAAPSPLSPTVDSGMRFHGSENAAALLCVLELSCKSSSNPTSSVGFQDDEISAASTTMYCNGKFITIERPSRPSTAGPSDTRLLDLRKVLAPPARRAIILRNIVCRQHCCGVLTAMRTFCEQMLRHFSGARKTLESKLASSVDEHLRAHFGGDEDEDRESPDGTESSEATREENLLHAMYTGRVSDIYLPNLHRMEKQMLNAIEYVQTLLATRMEPAARHLLLASRGVAEVAISSSNCQLGEEQSEEKGTAAQKAHLLAETCEALGISLYRCQIYVLSLFYVLRKITGESPPPVCAPVAHVEAVMLNKDFAQSLDVVTALLSSEAPTRELSGARDASAVRVSRIRDPAFTTSTCWRGEQANHVSQSSKMSGSEKVIEVSTFWSLLEEFEECLTETASSVCAAHSVEVEEVALRIASNRIHDSSGACTSTTTGRVVDSAWAEDGNAFVQVLMSEDRVRLGAAEIQPCHGCDGKIPGYQGGSLSGEMPPRKRDRWKRVMFKNKTSAPRFVAAKFYSSKQLLVLYSTAETSTCVAVLIPLEQLELAGAQDCCAPGTHRVIGGKVQPIMMEDDRPNAASNTESYYLDEEMQKNPEETGLRCRILPPEYNDRSGSKNLEVTLSFARGVCTLYDRGSKRILTLDLEDDEEDYCVEDVDDEDRMDEG
ncbi:unnamed protein product [Amoebophrya sp. A120]|nr:unnamed protein product [Amoebophrya sp. A120]|eukprot:GSA120T00002337001.1